MIVLDEISLVSAELFSKVDGKLRELRDSDLPFGGVSIFATGDFLQLRPIAETSLAGKLGNASKPLTAAAACGVQLWREHFVNVVFLEENLRAVSDPRFAALLSNARMGAYSDADIELLEQCVISAEKRVEAAEAVVSTLHIRMFIIKSSYYSKGNVELGIFPFVFCNLDYSRLQIRERLHSTRVVFVAAGVDHFSLASYQPALPPRTRLRHNPFLILLSSTT